MDSYNKILYISKLIVQYDKNINIIFCDTLMNQLMYYYFFDCTIIPINIYCVERVYIGTHIYTARYTYKKLAIILY